MAAVRAAHLPDARRAVVAAFSERGLRLERAALAALAEHVAGSDDGGGCDDAVDALLRAYEPGSSATPCLTLADARALVAAATGADAPSALVVQSVFDAPRIEYDAVRRRFHVLGGGGGGRAPRAPLLGSAADRAALHAQRFLVLAQRVERSPLFARPALAGMVGAASDEGGGRCELSDVRTLLAAPPGTTRILLGCLAQLEDGRFFVEDPTGSVPLDLTAADASNGYFTEGCGVLVEGALNHSRVFEVRALGQPPLEGRAATLAGPWAGLPTLLPRANAASTAPHPPPPRLVLLADCRLDDPATLPRLGAVFAGFEGAAAAAAAAAAAVGAPPPPPPAFVLMGDFWGGGAGWSGGGGGGGRAGAPGGGRGAVAPAPAASGADAAAQRAAFAALGALAARHPTLAAGSTFIFVPGPADAAAAGCSLLPGPPLPPSLAAPLASALGPARVSFPSNPARLRVGSRELVLFRSDVAARLRAGALLPPTDGLLGGGGGGGEGGGGPADPATAAAAAEATAFEHAALTLLSQAHLCPLPLDVSPVAWALDGGLRLYPLPDALVLAGGAGPGGRGGGRPLAVTVGGVACVDPGSLRAGRGGAFAAYEAGGGEVELCGLPEDE